VVKRRINLRVDGVGNPQTDVAIDKVGTNFESALKPYRRLESFTPTEAL
jgi:hypothetical protein